MTTEQKLEALNAIGYATVHMRTLTDWYCSVSGAHILEDSILCSPTSSNRTPEAAIEAAWDAYTKLLPTQSIVVDRWGKDSRQYRWNGYRWAEVGNCGVGAPR